MPNATKPKDVDVDVRIIRNPNEPGGVEFSMDSKLGNGEELTFSNNGHPGFNVRFHVIDDTGDNYLFMDEKLEPMWVKTITDPNESCPDAQHKDWHVFKTTAVEDNNTTLVVRNENPHKQLFKFALMFSRTPHQAPYEIMYDPIGNNTNGPVVNQGFLGGVSATTLAVGAVVLVAIVYALFQSGMLGG